MRAGNERLTILSEAEQSALYELPDFDDDQRLEYLTLTNEEQALALGRSHLSAKIYCLLQIGYFKAKKIFFRFKWQEVEGDIQFVMQQYFPEQSVFDRQLITKHEHYTQVNMISLLFKYQPWSKHFESQLRQQANQVILRDINPQFIIMDLLNLLREQKIIRPRYTTLQIIVRDALNIERKRLDELIKEGLSDSEKSTLQKMLLQANNLSSLAALKQDAKDFKARMMTAEREKLTIVKPLYKIAKKLFPILKISAQNIEYYASLVSYYSAHDLRERLKPEQTYLYLLCYIWQRYQQLNDNLVDAFCYHIKHFDDETKEKAKEEFSQHQKRQQTEWLVMKRLAQFFVDETISDDIRFGNVREKAFVIMSKDELRNKVSNPDEKLKKEMDFKWNIINKLASRFKLHLRPLAMMIDFSSVTPNSPWLAALDWLRIVFSEQDSLNQCPLSECPVNTIPKRLHAFLLEINRENQTTRLNADRYEFWIYRQLRKRLNSGELYLEDSVYHRSLTQELVSLKEKDAILESIDIPALRQPIKERLDALFSELHELWVFFNNEISAGNLKHLQYDEKSKTLHLKKTNVKKDEELQHNFYEQLPLCDVTDVLQFVNERCNYLSAFTHIQPRYAKQSADKNSLIAVISAQAMNHGNLNMAEISDIPYHTLHETYQSRVRLAVLKDANDIISNDIARMPIFPYYSFDLNILYGGVDGQKFEVSHPTTKARYSKKYFRKGKGMVAYTLLANHIPLQVELIGAHEHESYFVFDIWYNNTTEVIPDVVTGDMHCINKGNFAIMNWFGAKLYPRFTDINAQLKHLYCSRDLAEYNDYLIQPAGKLERNLIEVDWPNLQRVIATLALKEMKQSTLIKKLCTHTQANPIRKALFEYDKLIRSIHTLKYLLDPQIQKDTHRSQNRVESYHQERAAIAQVGGKKELAGRTDIAIEISNQCGRLVANAINHYNSSILSKLLQRFEATGNKRGIAMLKKISPVAWSRIHFQGHFKFYSDCCIDLDAIIEKLDLS
ncbi:MAG: Tn3 family transposase [Gammaproteobacteria bacterium]